MQGGYLPSGPNRYVLCCTPYLSSRSCSRDCSFTESIPCRRKRFVKPFCSRFSIRFQKDCCQQINRKNIWRFPYCTAPKRYFFYQPLTNGSQNGVSKKKGPVYWTIERSIYRPYLAFAIIPTRSCQKFSKQICLWNLAQGIGIIFIIQIVGAIWFFVAMVLPVNWGWFTPYKLIISYDGFFIKAF